MSLRRRKNGEEQSSEKTDHTVRAGQERHEDHEMPSVTSIIRDQPVWILLAVASGACAAINGVFAKLTTTALTADLAVILSSFLGLSPENNIVNLALRGTFFGLNLVFNGVMWALFTAALTKGNSTTRVSVVNVSANFFITAMLGWMIFGEKLPLQWWMGASLLAAGNVVIGRREEGEKDVGATLNEEAQRSADPEVTRLLRESDQDILIGINGPSSNKRGASSEEANRVRRGEQVDNPL